MTRLLRLLERLGFEARSLFKPEPVPDLNKLIDSVPGARKKLMADRAKMARSVPTTADVSQGGFKKNNQWTPERRQLHHSILKNIFTPQAVKAARPPAGRSPTLHLIGGRSGTGKSWFTSPQGTVDKSKAIYLNDDDIKESIPGYKGWNAGLVHEESSELGSHAEHVARKLGLNVIVDGTMHNSSSLEKRTNDYKKAGYKVHGHYMYTPPAKAAARSLGRYVTTGRYVDPKISLASTDNEANFDKVKDKFDDWEIHDNSVDKPTLSPTLYMRKHQAQKLTRVA